jgi:hypothetical protein
MIIQERMRNIIKRIASIKSHPSDYPEFLWLIFVFIGGAINSVALRQFGYWVISFGRIISIETLVIAIISGIFIFMIPLILSWFLSRNHPKNRFVPPLFVEAVSFGLLMFFTFNQFPQDFLYVYTLGLYAFVAGKIQDAIMIHSLGKEANSTNIIRYSIKVHADIDRAKEIVLSSQFRSLFKLQKKNEKEGETFKLRTLKNLDWQILIELKKPENDGQAIINFAFFDEGAYNLKQIQKTDDSYEYAISKIEHLRKYLQRHYSIKSETAPIENTESLVNYILRSFEGRLSHFHEMATQKRLSIILSFILIPASIVLFAYGQIGAGITTLVFATTLIINFIIGK